MQREKDDFCKLYTAIHEDAHVDELAFALDAFELMMTDRDMTKVTVVPAPCGIGKSRFTKVFMAYCVMNFMGSPKRDNSIGLIIVTDRVDRLQNYVENQENPYAQVENEIWGDLFDTKYNFRKYCSVILPKSKPYEKEVFDQLKEAMYKPVTLLSTQRYFNNMDNELHKMLFAYKNRHGNVGKKIVIFDEQPLFYSNYRLGIEHLNNCSTAINEGFQPTKESDDKEWLISEFEPFLTNLKNVLAAKDSDSKGRSLKNIIYWKSPENTITSDDSRFNKIIKKYGNELRSKYSNFHNDIQAIRQLLQEGGFFIAFRKNAEVEYSKHFELLVKQRDKFYLDKNMAKFFVLDATATVSPVYNVDYVDIKDYTAYFPCLNTTTIAIYDVNTSKTKLVRNSDNQLLINTIQGIIDRISEVDKDTLYISYKSIIDRFPKYEGDEKGCYFGNTKGTNRYLSCTQLHHIGTYRKPEEAILMLYFTIHPEKYEKLKLLTEAQSKAFISYLLKNAYGLFENVTMTKIMVDSMFEEFEQSVFRSAIRNRNNTEPVTINAFWNCTTYEMLNDKILKRFGPGGYGANVQLMGVPDEMTIRKIIKRKSSTGEMTNPQKIVYYLKSLPKRSTFLKSDMLKATGLSEEQFKKVKKNNPELKELLANSLIDARIGLYQVPDVIGL